MDTLLQVGDRFTSSKLATMLYGEVAHTEPPTSYDWVYDPITGEPTVDFAHLHTEDYDCPVTVHWKETNENGWYRDKEATLFTKVKDEALLSATWEVIKTDFTGGGTAHGQYDIYPDGHHVQAQRVGGTETLSFFQTGCFRGMLPPKDIVKVK